MRVLVDLPRVLSLPTQTLELGAGGTIATVVFELNRLYPELTSTWAMPCGDVQPFIAIFVNGDRLPPLSASGHPLADGDRVVLLSAIAGG